MLDFHNIRITQTYRRYYIYVCAGTGFKLAPVTGSMLADMAQGKQQRLIPNLKKWEINFK